MVSDAAPPLPWGGRAGRADKVLLSVLAFSGLYHLALLPLVPALIATQPLLLAVVRGSSTAIVTLGALARTGEGSLLVAALAGLPATIMFDWAYWWAGRRWGEHGLRLMLGRRPRAAARIDRMRALSRRHGVVLVTFSYLLPVPNAFVHAAAGWGGMRLRTFLACDIVAGLIWTALLAGLGYAVGRHAVDAVEAVSRYALALTVALVVYVIMRQVRAARRDRAT